MLAIDSVTSAFQSSFKFCIICNFYSNRQLVCNRNIRGILTIILGTHLIYQISPLINI